MKKSCNKPLTDGIDQFWEYVEAADGSRRVGAINLLRAARTSGEAKARRVAERLFEMAVIGPANRGREDDCQLSKHEDYDGSSPIADTEFFCSVLFHALKDAGIEPSFRRDLLENSDRVIDQLWHLRQMADHVGQLHEKWAGELVGFLLKNELTRGKIKAVDLVRYAAVMAA